MFFVYAGGRLAEVYQLKQWQERVKFPHQFCSPARSDHTVALLSNSPVKLMGVWVNTGIWGITQHWPGVCIWLRWYMQKFDGRFPVNWSCSAWCPCPCLSGRTWSKCFPSFYIFFLFRTVKFSMLLRPYTQTHRHTYTLQTPPKGTSLARKSAGWGVSLTAAEGWSRNTFITSETKNNHHEATESSNALTNETRRIVPSNQTTWQHW